MILHIKKEKAEVTVNKDGKTEYIATVKCDELSDLTTLSLETSSTVIKAGSIAIDTHFNLAMLNSDGEWQAGDETITPAEPENGGEE